MIARILALMLALSFAAGEDPVLYSTDRYPLPATVGADGVTRPAWITTDGKTLVGNVREKFKDGFVAKDATAWTFSDAASDRVFADGNVAGSSYIVMSKSVTTAGVSSFTSKQTFKVPSMAMAGLGLSSRVFGQEFRFMWVAVDDAGNPLTATNAGGTLVRNTDFRVHYAKVLDYFRNIVEAQHSGVEAKSVPVNVNSTVTVSASNLSCNVAQLGGQTVTTAGANGTLAVGGNIAASSATTTNPAPTGGRVFTSPDTTLAANDAAWHTITSGGALLTTGYGLPEQSWTYAAAGSGIVNTTTAVTIKAAAGAGLRNYLTDLDIMAETLTNATELAVRDGAAGTVIWRTKIPTTGLPQGRHITFNVPLKSTAATLLEVVTLTASGAGAVYVNANGFVAP